MLARPDRSRRPRSAGGGRRVLPRVALIAAVSVGALAHPRAWRVAAQGPSAQDGTTQHSPVAEARSEAAPNALPSWPVSSDPLVLARHVDRAGDDAVLAQLVPSATPLMQQLACVAAPHMRLPALALPGLATLMGVHDPDVAPAAAAAVVTILRAMSPADLAGAALPAQALRALVGQLDGLALQGRLRRDIAAAATVGAATLRDRLKSLGFDPDAELEDA